MGKVVGLGKIALAHDNSITNVYLLETVGYNLLSVSQLCGMGYNCLFTNKGVTVFRRDNSSIAFMGQLKGKVYIVDFSTEKVEPKTYLYGGKIRHGLAMAPPTSSCWNEELGQTSKGRAHPRTNQYCF